MQNCNCVLILFNFAKRNSFTSSFCFFCRPLIYLNSSSWSSWKVPLLLALNVKPKHVQIKYEKITIFVLLPILFLFEALNGRSVRLLFISSVWMDRTCSLCRFVYLFFLFWKQKISLPYLHNLSNVCWF